MSGTDRTIGFIGLGIMGKPASKNLVDAGYELIVNDVREEPVAELEAYGAESRATPREVTADADVVITFLPEGKHVREVALGEEGVIEGAEPGEVYIDMSTIGPSAIREVAEELDAAGVETIDAPVSGSEEGAREAWMSIMIGGEEEAVAAHRDLFEVMGGNVVHVGATGAGQVAKVCNNMIVAAEVTSLAEALVFAEKAGIDQGNLIEAIRGGAAQTWALDTRAEGMIDGEFEPGFFASYMYKDLRIATNDGEEYGAPQLITATNHELFKSLEEQGYGDLDFSGVMRLYEDLAGIE
ncbi:NAD-binding protein [Natronomonas sp. F2-12]|jgi:2-hydroxy-3-oxopropionate reductase|uniref:NAD-binding protein n=1 Tax=Natronomonas aquatica TaxID=2841590 RepID=A0A9R1D785_9EURY|nr:NAD(P)-binding domain-containing protein [Natronomonas aquatica]MCQ4332980.1 NAD-binding protein [Natronomonas aquatica]